MRFLSYTEKKIRKNNAPLKQYKAKACSAQPVWSGPLCQGQGQKNVSNHPSSVTLPFTRITAKLHETYNFLEKIYAIKIILFVKLSWMFEFEVLTYYSFSYKKVHWVSAVILISCSFLLINIYMCFFHHY